ncbi:hypothetical protein T459_07767 [Capsicum annuum]|uniref:Uncharacterized protein n=1 Tax=Capsicum annuum TaxID=4072 RepID=A0A2G2ZUM8_CAPAN|nr:hypothetical protein T459_07767 [Capsicum annuum]
MTMFMRFNHQTLKAAIKNAGMQQKALGAVEKMEKRSARDAKPITSPFSPKVNGTRGNVNQVLARIRGKRWASIQQEVVAAIWIALIYHTWKGRNWKIFRRQTGDTEKAIAQIKQEHRLEISYIAKKLGRCRGLMQRLHIISSKTKKNEKILGDFEGWGSLFRVAGAPEGSNTVRTNENELDLDLSQAKLVGAVPLFRFSPSLSYTHSLKFSCVCDENFSECVYESVVGIMCDMCENGENVVCVPVSDVLCGFWFDYSVHEDRANQFYVAIRKYYPGLKDGSLEPGYAGIRPKLFGPEEGPTDFVVQVTHRTYSKFQPEWSLKFRSRSVSSLYCATLITCD